MTDKLAASPVTLIRMAEVAHISDGGVPSVLIMFNGDDSHEDTETRSEVSGNDREYVRTPERLAPFRGSNSSITPKKMLILTYEYTHTEDGCR
jgi:hypothetical protein